MSLFRKVTAAATGLWSRPGPERPAAPATPRPRPAGLGPRAPATDTPLPLRVRHAPQGTAAPEPATAQAGPPEDRMLSRMKAAEERRQAALDQLKQVSTEWAEVQQASAAAAARPQRLPTLAQLFKEEDARDAAALASTPHLTRTPAHQRHDDHSAVGSVAAAWDAGQKAQVRKPVRFATQAEVRTLGSDGAPLSQGRMVDLDPATGRPMGKDPVRNPVPRTAPARPAARPAQSEPGPSTAPAATTPAPSLWQPLSADERRCVAQALPGGGRALRRLADRAARADLAVSTGLRAGITRLVGPGAPRPLDGHRRDVFRELLGHDVHTLADHAKLDVASAAGLLLRAVESGAVGTGLRLDDRLLLLGMLGHWAPKEPVIDMPWAALNDVGEAPMRDWWAGVPEAHKKAIEQAFGDETDYQGTALLDGAESGDAEAMQRLHDHLFDHYRFERDDRLHRIKPTDTGIARNHIGLMPKEAPLPVADADAGTDAATAVDPRQAELEKIYAANDVAKRQHRYLHGDPQPPEAAQRPAEPPRAGPSSG